MKESIPKLVGRAQGTLLNARDAERNGKYPEAILLYREAAKYYIEAAEQASLMEAKKYLDEARYCNRMADGLTTQYAPKKVRIESGYGAEEEEIDCEKSTKFRQKQNPRARLSSVAGMKPTIQELQDLLTKDSRDPLTIKWGIAGEGDGILFYGPPGCGKTLLIEALGNEMDCEWFEATGADIVSRWYGEATRNVKHLFKCARWTLENKKKRVIIFLDDFDTIAKRRITGELHEETQRVVTQFLHELNCMPEGITVFAASNYPWNLDPAFIRAGRIGRHIFLSPPDFDARKEMLMMKLRDKPGGETLDYDELAKLTNGYSAADIMAKGGICDIVLNKCYREEKHGKHGRVMTMEDFREALRIVQPKIISYVKEIEIALRDPTIGPFIESQYPKLVEMVETYSTIFSPGGSKDKEETL
jgi:SpoVK/Ycf46/Vps4 family AAA+-type ATPase